MRRIQINGAWLRFKISTNSPVSMKPFFLFFLFWQACFQTTIQETMDAQAALPVADSTIELRFSPPSGFKRTTVASGSFASYLRALPLKPPGSPVLLFDGRKKANTAAFSAVVDLPIGNKDLHQCADAVMRLRAEYFWQKRQFSRIHFKLTNGFQVDYERWRKGERVKVTGNKTEWAKTTAPSDTYATFWQYLEFVFMYAGTLSLSKELQPVSLKDLQIGDVFIRGGSPGHAVIVVDMAVNNAGQKVFMLAQSYMPAQEIQVLNNPDDTKLSPWYILDSNALVIDTPEWRFRPGELMRF